jgi:uncharacterized protein YceK
MKVIQIVCLAAMLVAGTILTGCASIVNGTHQSVSVHTGTIPGATCELENNKGKWFVNQTPGSVTVQRSYKDLVITCQKRNHRNALTRVASKTKGMAFGNIVFGGVIGAGVDMANGAAYDYPVDINVPMV